MRLSQALTLADEAGEHQTSAMIAAVNILRVAVWGDENNLSDFQRDLTGKAPDFYPDAIPLTPQAK